MKSSTFNIVISVIVVSVLIMSMLSSCSRVRPYVRHSMFSNQYPYEGFASMEYSNNVPGVSDSSINDYSMSSGSVDCKKVYGFDGLYCKPYVADSAIDKFSTAQGDPKNIGNSSGLSNSRGSLVLSNELTNLLRTRGGNQTGGPDQIGSK
jgi:hypothetical protein